jgi:Zn-dependent protease with chaperone function
MITTVAYAAVSFLIAMVSSWVGSLIALRPLGRPPPVFWVDRARLAYPARLAAALNTIFLSIIAGVVGYGLYDKSANPPTGIDVAAMVIGAYVGGLIIVLCTEKRVRDTTFRSGSWISNLGFRLVLFSPHIFVLFATPQLLPDSLDFQAIVILIAALLILAFGASGGGYMIARWIRLARPASPRLVDIVAEATARTGIHAWAAYELKSSTANAIAIPIWRRLVFTNTALETLTDAELTAVCVHELAHLNEPWILLTVRVIRGMLLFLPILVASPVWHEFGGWGVYGLICGCLIAYLLTGRIPRRMEVRADAAGRTHEGEEGTYARALERLYEINLVPAVMPGKRRPHPHLYDRLITAGVPPSYPRPLPPSSDRRFVATLVTIAIALVLYGTMFKVLGGPVYFS